MLPGPWFSCNVNMKIQISVETAAKENFVHYLCAISQYNCKKKLFLLSNQTILGRVETLFESFYVSWVINISLQKDNLHV